ncbi:MAG: hypothetical protein Q8O42_14685 [Acidobacteriota bacterium]|nr:hypothetical protein [Acidobacteriota bacterium]
MRALVTTVAAVLLASAVQVDRISILPLAAQDRVAGVLAEAKKALGGEEKVAALKGLTAEGPFRRSMGGRDMEGMMALTIVRPDKMRRVEEISMGGMVGGPMMERTSVLAGNVAWDDTANRGGMGGGMRMEIRTGPGPGGPGGPGGPAMTEEQMNEARVRRARVQLHRWMAALVAEGPAAWTDAGIAESPDGKADILETKEETGRVLRLFIDQATHLPLMVQYQDPKPMVMIAGGPGGPGRGPGGPPPQMTQEEMQKRAEEMRKNPPALGLYAMHLGDYKKVDGIMLPHKIDVSLDGQPNEEWTVEKYRVNPTIKADTWEKK